MLIDFHVHVFPDRIAEKTVSKLAGIACLPPYTNGTLDDTAKKMRAWGVDKFVMLNIATTPHQQTSILNSCIDIRERFPDTIIPFPSVHPDAEDVLEALDAIAANGFKGVKFHPDYQAFFINDPKMDAIYEKCAKLGLIAVFHAGYDPVSPEVVHASPAAIAEVAARHPDFKLVAAHFGSNRMWDEVEKHLCGTNVYLDTSFANGEIPLDVAKRLVAKHDVNRILFASDCPWKNSADEKKFICSAGFDERVNEKIFHENAERLLGL